MVGSFFYFRLLHPLSPRGKLVHWGLEGLAATNQMIQAAMDATAANHDISSIDVPISTNSIRVRDELYRLATSDEQTQQLRDVALRYPSIAEWVDDVHHDVPCHASSSSSNVTETGVPLVQNRGGLRMKNGCCVLHVPSYLKGVYKACQIEAQRSGSSIQWRQTDHPPSIENLDDTEEQYNATILCYGSNMFTQNDAIKWPSVEFTALSSRQTSDVPNRQLPVQLVRGQSIEMQLEQPLRHALLCGKYITPLPSVEQQQDDLPQTNRVLIGATHEFSLQPMSANDVVADLRARTHDFAPFQYQPQNNTMLNTSEPSDTDHNTVLTQLSLSNQVMSLDRITCGYRVQSTRSAYGRRPIIGQLQTPTLSTSSTGNRTKATTATTTAQGTHWIFTGLSSRGLLYHALYGELLAQAIVQNDETILLQYCPDLLWWKV
jgi:hypothetical protein